MFRLTAGLVLDHAGKAFWASSTAWTASPTEALLDCQRSLPVPGLRTVKVVFVVTSLPLRKSGTVPVLNSEVGAPLEAPLEAIMLSCGAGSGWVDAVELGEIELRIVN